MGIVIEDLTSEKQPLKLGGGQQFLKIIIQFSREVVLKPCAYMQHVIIHHFYFIH